MVETTKLPGALALRIKGEERIDTSISASRMSWLPPEFGQLLMTMSEDAGQAPVDAWTKDKIRVLFVEPTLSGDVHIAAAGVVNRVLREKNSAFRLYLNEDSLLPDVTNEDARLLSVLSLSLPPYVTERLANVAHAGAYGGVQVIPKRDFHIIEKGELFRHATLIQTILDEFDGVLHDPTPLWKVEGRSQEEIWANALKTAIKLLHDQVVVPTELTYQAILTWKSLGLSFDASSDKHLLHFGHEGKGQRAPENGAFAVDVSEVGELRKKLGSDFVDGRVISNLIDELTRTIRYWRYDDSKFMKRFPYPGNLRL